MKTLIKSFTTTLLALLIALPVFASERAEDIRTIYVKGTDNMQFDVTTIEAKPGEQLRITLETVSSMPASAMKHNLAIIDLEVDLEEFVLASMSDSDNEYIAPAYEDEIIAYTEMIGGGKTSTIDFTVPETTGDYDYVCTFPGHYFGGMAGILKVR